mmetsp:Transcript_68065/g.127110  ORF Transcript_68065/g.127110 Transcript_68065/m.127110 type:complete len:212 (+) Transcript_68065:55-690(+)
MQRCSVFAVPLLQDAEANTSHTQAVLVDSTDEEELVAEGLFSSLLHCCKQLREGECMLFCDRRHVHRARFAANMATAFPGGTVDEGYRRIHIKYVSPPQSADETPPVISALVSLQTCRFLPAVVAVLGLSDLLSPPDVHSRRAHLAGLAVALLTDSASQLGRNNPCRVVLWDNSAKYAPTVAALLAASCHTVWSSDGVIAERVLCQSTDVA